MNDFFEATTRRSSTVGSCSGPDGAASTPGTFRSTGDSLLGIRKGGPRTDRGNPTRQRGRYCDSANETGRDVRSLTIKRSGGEQRYVLERGPGGLYVACEGISTQGTRTLGLMQFNDAGSFERWWDDDQLRFEQPLLHLSVKRFASELWGSDAGDKRP